FKSLDQLEQAITEYIFYYNNKRIKTKLKGLSPVQYRTNTQLKSKIAEVQSLSTIDLS
ncbi:IS3 family transposase, partial [Streptococcus suis]